MVKNLPASAGDVRDTGFDHWVGKIPWRRDGYPVQCSCLENPVNRGASGLQSIGSRESGVTELTYPK